MIIKKAFVFLSIISFAYSADIFIENACKRVFYVDTNTLDAQRKDDLNFQFTDTKCCCNDKILSLFRDRTDNENQRVNPAVNTMLQSLAEMEKTIRLRVKEVENLKQINAMYSFDRIAYIQPKTKTKYEDSDISCRDIDLSNPSDMDYYLHTVDMMENGGTGSYDLVNSSSGATGRYQIIPKYANTWCKNTTPEYNCCATWKHSRECQDEMFDYLTQQNINQLKKMSSSLPLTNCSLYIAHQQGTGGMAWIYTGKIPQAFKNDDGSINFAKMKKNVYKNLSGKYREEALNATTPDELRNIYIEYWSDRFGSDILQGGSPVSVEDFVDSYDTSEEILEKRKALWREGIILELQRINLELKKIKEYKK